MAEILPIRRKTLSSHSIHSFICSLTPVPLQGLLFLFFFFLFCRRYMAELLPIRCKTQSINQLIFFFVFLSHISLLHVPFLWISWKSKLEGRLQNFITYHLPNSHRRYMTWILPIRRKTQNIQSFQSIHVPNIWNYQFRFFGVDHKP